MIEELLDAYRDMLAAEAVPGGLLEGVKSVKVGDDLPLSDRELPGIALDVVSLPRDPVSSGSQAPGGRFEWPIPVRIVLYDTDSLKVSARRRIWNLLYPPTPTTPGGLVWAINKYSKVQLDSGTGFFVSAGPFNVGTITGKGGFRLVGAVSTINFITWGPKPS